MAIEKIKILGAVLELPAQQHCQFSPFSPIFEINGLDWQCYLASSSKSAPRILIFFSIAMGADYLIELISIETYAPQYIGHNKIFLESVVRQLSFCRHTKLRGLAYFENNRKFLR